METGASLWEYEVVKNSQAKVLQPNFLSIEGESNCIWGLAFVEDKTGVDNFTAKVIETSTGVTPVKKKPTASKPKDKKKGGFLKKIKNMFGGKEEKAAPVKINISAPTNFQRAAHMGLESGGGFKFENIPSEWQKFFQDAGYSKEELQDEKLTKKLVKKMKKFEKKQRKKKPPPPPPSSKPPTGSSSGPPPPPSGGIPPPPPPPPMGMAKKNPTPRRPPPSMPSGGSSSGGGSPKVSSPSNSGAGRGDLLAAIRAGKQLRKTEGPKKITLDINDTEVRNDLMSVLNRKMAARKNALDESSDEESSESDLSSDDDF
eukprot:CAMPEP_0117430326 /NCGR_PEP_ID=MMETSP0758-20121206/9850_1 /TAXON_ID=63605 /ORGANISM="Percolomonas cosmopolitus, Strain AE-1 (ATCC 50343)" /LENGTH=314 /DNA_ID=CAMNT_0005218203 /DNA_START=210 /DNA_END=1154 /DNA_ORIENTATION=-